MAEDPLSYLIEKALEKLASLVSRESVLTYDFKSDLEKLRHSLTTVEAVRLDADARQVENVDVSVWLGRLKEVAYDMTDLLDEFEYEALRTQEVSRKVRLLFFSFIKSFVYRFKMGSRIKDIRRRLEEIAKEKNDFHIKERLEGMHTVHMEREREGIQRLVIGRDNDKQRIIDLLMDPENYVSVIPIVGIGGLGKTTLARYVYDDESVARNFDCKLWVSMSQDFKVSNLAKEILTPAGAEAKAGMVIENLKMDHLEAIVRNILKGKKFLIILDDVWNVSTEEWNDLKNSLVGGARGSKIVVTTRYHKVASVMSPTGPIHEIKGLPEANCLSLFLKWAFNEGEEKQYPELVDIGEEIVKKCRNGVPLAVRALGSLLYSKTDHRDWISIRDSEIWRQNGNYIMPLLTLSYQQLPSYLKQCFAYCSLYPKGYSYDSKELIQCWMANGLLFQTSNKTTQDPENIGLQHIKELLSRSFFQDLRDFGSHFRFKMHDLFHDLSLHVAQNDYCLIENPTNYNARARHVSFLGNHLGVDEATMVLHKLSNKVRTIFFPSEDVLPVSVDESFVKTCISRFKLLRLLDLSFSSIEQLPNSINTLKLLTYLSLCGNKKIKKLPNSICNLQNLETLILVGCKELEELPRDIYKMTSLRYLSITTKQTCLPDNGIECLHSLRTLIFEDCPRIESLAEGIQRLTALRRLAFGSCECLISLPRGMKQLTALESLTINGCGKLDFVEGEDYPMSLRSVVVGALPQLVALPQWLRGSAKSLQFLCISDCDYLGALPEWFSDLSSLRKLEIWGCQKLTSMPEGMDHLTALRDLVIEDNYELSRNCK